MGTEAEGSGPSPAVFHLISADTSAWRAEGFRFGATFRFDVDGADRQVRTFTAAVLCIFGRVCPDRSPGEVPVELSVRGGCPAIADLLGMSAAVAGPGLQLPPGRSWLLLSWPLCLFALQVQIMDASLDNFSISRNPTRMEHHSVDMSGIWVSFKVALVGWTYVFDAAFGQHVRYSMTPKCWRCTVFSSVHAVPSNLEACLVLRTDHIPV